MDDEIVNAAYVPRFACGVARFQAMIVSTFTSGEQLECQKVIAAP